ENFFRFVVEFRRRGEKPGPKKHPESNAEAGAHEGNNSHGGPQLLHERRHWRYVFAIDQAGETIKSVEFAGLLPVLVEPPGLGANGEDSISLMRNLRAAGDEAYLSGVDRLGHLGTPFLEDFAVQVNIGAEIDERFRTLAERSHDRGNRHLSII